MKGSTDPPYGYMIIAACNFSKTTRDTFRSEMHSRGIQEFFLWGKGELEDMLYLPKNDHLLFAYFGISLQIRRRSLKTRVSAALTLKRKLVKVLGDIQNNCLEPVLIRDPRQIDYPKIGDVGEFIKKPRWQYFAFAGHQPVDHVAFIVKRSFAYVDFNSNEWDAALSYSDQPTYKSIHGIPEEMFREYDTRSQYSSFWNEQIPEVNRAWFKVIRTIPYDRILAIDDIGDIYNEPPHLLVEFRPDGDPFEPGSHPWIEGVGSYRPGIRPEKDKRVKFFPDIKPVPKKKT